MPLDRLRRVALRTIAVACVGVALWLALRGTSEARLTGALASVDGRGIVAACLPLLAAGSVLRTGRYRALLPRDNGHPRFRDLWSAVMVSGAGNNLLPLRAGELLRTRATMATGLPLAPVATAQVVEKVVEAATLMLWAMPALACDVGIRRPTIVVAAAIALTAFLVTWAARRYGHVDLGRLAASGAWSLVADAVEIAIIAVCLRGVGLPAGLVPSVTVFAAVNLAIALPSTPGNLGAMEAGAALALITLGTPRDTAMAFAIVYRAVQWFPVTAVGALLLATQPRASAS